MLCYLYLYRTKSAPSSSGSHHATSPAKNLVVGLCDERLRLVEGPTILQKSHRLSPESHPPPLPPLKLLPHLFNARLPSQRWRDAAVAAGQPPVKTAVAAASLTSRGVRTPPPRRETARGALPDVRGRRRLIAGETTLGSTSGGAGSRIGHAPSWRNDWETSHNGGSAATDQLPRAPPAHPSPRSSPCSGASMEPRHGCSKSLPLPAMRKRRTKSNYIENGNQLHRR